MEFGKYLEKQTNYTKLDFISAVQSDFGYSFLTIKRHFFRKICDADNPFCLSKKVKAPEK